MSPDGAQTQADSPSASPLPSRSYGAAAVEREPSAGTAPVPGWLIGALALFIYVGDMYVTDHGDYHGQGFDSRVYYPFASLEEVQDHQPKIVRPEGWDTGKVAFSINCAPCHGAEGQGNPANGTPPLALSEWVNAEHADRMARIVLDAVGGPITVAGGSFNSEAMVAWREVYKNDDKTLAGVLTFVRGSFGNKGSPVTPAQFAAIRKATDSHAGKKWTAAELGDIKP